jgi:16S rRNA processing protein RimM
MAPKRTAGGADAVPPASPSPSDASATPVSVSTVAAPMPVRLTVALIRGVRGLKGHVRVELLTDRPEERFVEGARLFVEGTPRVLTIAEAAAVADGPGWWLRFHEIPTREAADTLRDRYLEIEPPAEPREPGQWFFHELIGLAVRSTEGEELGSISDIYRAGGAEVFVVRGPRGEIDIPGVRGIVTELAPDRGELIVDMAVLDLDARPVDDEDYVRPRDRRPRKQPKPKGPAQPPKGTRPAKGAKPAAKGAAPTEPVRQPAKATRPVKTKLPKGAASTRTLTPEEIAEAMAAAGKPMPAQALPPTSDEPASSD